ncbi:MAG: hypothetical protein AABZ47_02095 [Planctomycetota bacterium]
MNDKKNPILARPLETRFEAADTFAQSAGEMNMYAMARRLGCVLGFMAASALPCVVWATDIGTASDPGKKNQSNQETSGGRQPNAEELVRALQGTRTSPPVIPPASALRQGSVVRKATLWPDGWTFSQQSGRLSFERPWWVFHWADEKNGRPVRMLPNATLERMMGSLDESGRSPVISVSGEMTVFEGENYFLAVVAMLVGTSEPVRSDTSPSPSPSAVAPVEDVVKLLESQQPERQVIRPGALEKKEVLDPLRPVRWTPHMDGAPLANRPGRLVAAGAWWTFVFESDHPDRPEPPMKVLPNQTLEVMRRMMERDPSGLVFIVSGEATAFQGENYFLTRSTMKRADTGNLGK